MSLKELIISNKLSKYLNKSFTMKELNIISNKIKDIDNKLIENKVDKESFSVERYVSEISDVFTRDDLKKYMLQEINKSTEVVSSSYLLAENKVKDESNIFAKKYNVEVLSILKRQNDKTLRYIFNPAGDYKTKLIFLDTFYQRDITNGSGKYSWDLSYKGTPDNKSVFIQEDIKNIVALQLGPTKWTVTDFIYNYFDDDRYPRITILIEELSAQSFIGSNGRKYHFMVMPAISGNDDTTAYESYEMTTKGFNNGWFHFRRPVTELRTITLSYAFPMDQIPVIGHKIFGILVQNSNPMTIDFSTTGSRTYAQASNYQISGFTTCDTVADADLIESVNSYYGPSTGGGRDSIEFPFDLSGMTACPDDIIVYISFNEIYRQIYPLKIVYMG